MDMQDQNQLYEDDEDRKRLEAMPEIEREAILAERFEKRKAELDMKAALRDAKRREKEEKKALEKQTMKRKAPAAKKVSKNKKIDDTINDAEVAQTLAGRRTSTRDRNVNKKKESKVTALAKLREERQKALEQKADDDDSESDFGDDDDDSDDDYDELKPWQKAAKETANKRQKRSTAKSQLDRYDEEEEEEEEEDLEDAVADTGRRAPKQKVPKADVPADLDDFLKVTISRRRLGIWCSEPFFEDAVVGSYVKLFVGEDENGKRCYRLCRVVGVTTASKPYDIPVEGKNAKAIKTDKKLTLRFQKYERDFYIRLVSDNKVDESDVNQYITAMKGARLDDEILGKREAIRIRRKRDELTTSYTYTKEDIEKSINERKKKGQTMANLGAEQTRVEIEVQAAREKVENAKRTLLEAPESQQREAEEALKDAERNLQMKLQEEEEITEKVKSRKDRLKNQNKSQQWAKVNERAIRTNRQADVGAFKEKETDVELAANGKPVFNPYARRKVKPKILWEVGQKDDEKKEGEVTASVPAKDSGSSSKTDNVADDTTPALVQEQHSKATALSQSHQFTIDEEILAQSSFTSGMAGLKRKKAQPRARKGMSLSEYQDRKANGTL
jgi:RNA polymerase-associated protein RTF1